MAIGTQYSPSRLRTAPAAQADDLGSKGLIDARAGGSMSLGETRRPIDGVWPPLDGTNGPLIADDGIVDTLPSTTGLKFIPWNSGKFNLQSQNWLPVPAGNAGAGTAECCINVTTPRGNWGSTGVGFPAHGDFGFVADWRKMILVYRQNAGYYASSYNEIDVFIEHEGRMKGVRKAPAMWPHGSGGNQLFYRPITLNEVRRKQVRVQHSANLYFVGMWIDTDANVEKSPNLPLYAYPGDSWTDGFGNIFGGANAGIVGVTYGTSASLLRSNMCIGHMLKQGNAGILMGQGGTGWKVNNSGIGVDSTSQGFSSFMSTSQINFLYDTFGSRLPHIFVAGGWNDGLIYAAEYSALATAGFNKARARDKDVHILVAGIQPKLITPGDGRDLSNQALKAASLAHPNVIGFLDQLFRWPYPGIPDRNIGPDTLHPRMEGTDDTGTWYQRQSENMMISRNRHNQQLAA